MKIAVVSPFQRRLLRGIERFSYILSEKLAEQNSVDLIAWEEPDAAPVLSAPSRARMLLVPYQRYYQASWAVPFYSYWFLRNSYDWILLSFAGYGEGRALKVAQVFGCKSRIMLILHFPYSLVPHRYQEFDDFGVLKRADQIIAVSETVAQEFTAQYPEYPCKVIHNGVDVDFFRPDRFDRSALRMKFGLSEKTPLLITTAALEARKGIQWVFYAIPYLLEQFPDLQYWVLGEGPDRPMLESIIEEHGLRTHVRLLGQVNQVEEYYAVADIGLLLAQGEAFGISVIEYMSMGLPVICSEHPPLPALVLPDAGILLDETDTLRLAESIGELLSNRERRQQMADAGRKAALRQFSLNTMATRYLESLQDYS